MRDRLRALLVALAVVLLGATACAPSDEADSADEERGSTLIKAQDAKTLTLQLGDLPADWSATEGALIELTPNNLDQQHATGDLRTEDYNLLKELRLRSVATRSFTVRGDGAVNSTVALFEDLESARRWYGRPTGGQTISDAPKYGDESFTERTEVDTDPSDDRNIVQASIRTVIRVENAVLEVTNVDDPSQLEADDSIELAKEAVEKLP